MTMPLFVGLLSFLFTGLVIGLLTRQQILDLPEGRRVDERPTPRGGGLAMFGILLPTLLVVGGMMMLPFWTGLAGLIVLSFADDLYDLPPLPRFSGQIAAVILGLLALPSQGPLLTVFAAVLWIWFINVFNFMDGVDGMAGVESLTIGGGAALITALAGPAGAAGGMGLATAAAAAGFLPWNWRPARIFLGEVGSVPLGYLLGFILLSLAVHGFPIPAAILVLAIATDATLTLLRRLLRREPVWKPHRTHWYQRAAAATRHDTVSLHVAVANIALVGLAGAMVVTGHDLILLGAAFAVVLLLLLDFTRLARRKPQRPRRRPADAVEAPEENLRLAVDTAAPVDPAR